MKLLLALLLFQTSSYASIMDEHERQACLASVKENCSPINPRGIINQSLQMQMIQCEKDLEARGLKCDQILPQNQEKRRCNATQFCDKDNAAEVLKNCGLEFLTPFWNALWGPIELGISIVSSVAESVWVCTTKKNCGTPQLSTEDAAALKIAQQKFADQLIEDEKKEEADLCESQNRFGCPLPDLSCRQWEQLQVKSKIEVEGQIILASSISDKDGFNKNNFCRRALESLSKKRDELKHSSARKAAVAMNLWFQDYMQSFECYQPRYAAEQICRLTGESISFFAFSKMLIKALRWAKEGKTEREIAELLKTTEKMQNEASEIAINSSKYVQERNKILSNENLSTKQKNHLLKQLDKAQKSADALKMAYGDLLFQFDGQFDEILVKIQNLEKSGVSREKIRQSLQESAANPKICSIK